MWLHRLLSCRGVASSEKRRALQHTACKHVAHFAL
jgi:hypothetical protein